LTRVDWWFKMVLRGEKWGKKNEAVGIMGFVYT